MAFVSSILLQLSMTVEQTTPNLVASNIYSVDIPCDCVGHDSGLSNYFVSHSIQMGIPGVPCELCWSAECKVPEAFWLSFCGWKESRVQLGALTREATHGLSSTVASGQPDCHRPLVSSELHCTSSKRSLGVWCS